VRAAANYRFIDKLHVLDLPRFACVDAARCVLGLERIEASRVIEHNDLKRIAYALGRFHATVRPLLSTLNVASPARITDTDIGAFHPLFAEECADRRDEIAAAATLLPNALYKDSNVRNFIVQGRRILVIDFDDLTLAPTGYDLAKLIVSHSLTTGESVERFALSLLRRYEAGYRRTCGVSSACSADALQLWIDVNEALTKKYIGRNGYRCSLSITKPIVIDHDRRAR
jgi:hypothetical protein